MLVPTRLPGAPVEMSPPMRMAMRMAVWMPMRMKCPPYRGRRGPERDRSR
ncbi:hypothetical protein EES43_12720 [Streptomyces sp. ADI96-02]|nr:hypothetical protein EES43_12720 [Streptomyces sp. ADI96-02]